MKTIIKHSIIIIAVLTIAGCNRCSKSDHPTAPIEQDAAQLDNANCSGEIGGQACNFTLRDQNDKEWDLYDHRGSVMVIEFSTMWCGLCNVIGPKAQIFQDKYSGIIWITILVDNEDGNQVSLKDVQTWAKSNNATTSPVLVGNRDLIDHTGKSGYPITAWPTFIIIDKDMIMKYGLIGWDEMLITEALTRELKIDTYKTNYRNLLYNIGKKYELDTN